VICNQGTFKVVISARRYPMEKEEKNNKDEKKESESPQGSEESKSNHTPHKVYDPMSERLRKGEDSGW